MRSSANLVMQVLAVLASLSLRFTSAGIVTRLLVLFFPITICLIALQIAPAAIALFHRHLSVPATVSSSLAAGCCLGASLFFTDPGQGGRPVDVLFGGHADAWADQAATLLGLGWGVAVLASLVTVLGAVVVKPVAPSPGP